MAGRQNEFRGFRDQAGPLSWRISNYDGGTIRNIAVGEALSKWFETNHGEYDMLVTYAAYHLTFSNLVNKFQLLWDELRSHDLLDTYPTEGDPLWVVFKIVQRHDRDGMPVGRAAANQIVISLKGIGSDVSLGLQVTSHRFEPATLSERRKLHYQRVQDRYPRRKWDRPGRHFFMTSMVIWTFVCTIIVASIARTIARAKTSGSTFVEEISLWTGLLSWPISLLIAILCVLSPVVNPTRALVRPLDEADLDIADSNSLEDEDVRPFNMVESWLGPERARKFVVFDYGFAVVAMGASQVLSLNSARQLDVPGLWLRAPAALFTQNEPISWDSVVRGLGQRSIPAAGVYVAEEYMGEEDDDAWIMPTVKSAWMSQRFILDQGKIDTYHKLMCLYWAVRHDRTDIRDANQAHMLRSSLSGRQARARYASLAREIARDAPEIAVIAWSGLERVHISPELIPESSRVEENKNIDIDTVVKVSFSTSDHVVLRDIGRWSTVKVRKYHMFGYAGVLLTLALTAAGRAGQRSLAEIATTAGAFSGILLLWQILNDAVWPGRRTLYHLLRRELDAQDVEEIVQALHLNSSRSIRDRAKLRIMADLGPTLVGGKNLCYFNSTPKALSARERWKTKLTKWDVVTHFNMSHDMQVVSSEGIFAFLNECSSPEPEENPDLIDVHAIEPTAYGFAILRRNGQIRTRDVELGGQ